MVMSKSPERLFKMQQSEAIEAMLADSALGLMVDRRSPSGDRPLPPQLAAIGPVELDPNPDISVWLVRARCEGELPRRLDGIGFGRQRRMLDRFYLPDEADEAVVRALFDVVAPIYDRLAGNPLNVITAQTLLAAVVDAVGSNPLVLDFGCGTGVAVEAAVALGRPLRLLGTDLSESMMHLARSRGEETMALDDWRASDRRIDGAIACFVAHYGISDADLAHIAQTLRPGAVFAVNLFRMTDEPAADFASRLADLGLVRRPRRSICVDRPDNVVAIFGKPS